MKRSFKNLILDFFFLFFFTNYLFDQASWGLRKFSRAAMTDQQVVNY